MKRMILADAQGREVCARVRVTGGGARRALFEGVVVTVLNARTAPLFLAFLPQCVVPDQALMPQRVLLGKITVTLNTLADVAAVLARQKA